MLLEQQYGFDRRTGEIVWKARPVRPMRGRQGLGFASAGAGATAAATGGGIAASIATAGILAAPMALQIWLNRKGPGQKRSTSMIADEAERLLTENLELYLAGTIDQSTAVGNFETVWRWLLEGCSSPSMGEPGARCVNERKRGGQWDWFARYRDPITDTPAPAAVAPDGRAVVGNGSPLQYAGAGGLSTTTLLIAALAVGAALTL